MIDRRLMLHGLLLGAGALLAPRGAQAVDSAANVGMSRVTAYAFTFKGLDSGAILLSSYAGHPILVVNTASLCGRAAAHCLSDGRSRPPAGQTIGVRHLDAMSHD